MLYAVAVMDMLAAFLALFVVKGIVKKRIAVEL